MRTYVAQGLIILACLFTAAVAEGTTPVAYVKGSGGFGTSGGESAVTSGAMSRARADIAIRRIRSVIVSKASVDDDQTFEHLEKLQKQLRGQN
jgi:hypothetical protein